LASTLQETVPAAVTEADTTPKALDAEEVTAIATTFLKRIGHKGNLNPKRVSMEEDTYTVEVEMKKFTATVKISALNREIKEYDVQPKNEEASFSTFSPKFLISIAIVSSVVCTGIYFALKFAGI
jgi:hypothetical protein